MILVIRKHNSMNDSTRLVDRQLETSRYFLTDVQEDCVCCGVTYAGSGPFCMRCMAPLELSRTVRRRGTPPRFIPVLGASGAGKTVYLGMLLDILSKGTQNLAGLTTGSFSMGLQIQTTTALENRRFPEKTPVEAEGWQWVHCEVTGRAMSKAYADVITPDFAGESLAQEIDHPNSYPAIRHVLEKAQGLLVLCDSMRVRDAALGEDLFAMKLASYLVQLHESLPDRRHLRKLEMPLAVVLTKSDECPEAGDNPELFASSNLPRLLQFCQRRFAKHGFFASSVVGSSARLIDAHGCRTQVPLHIEPHGIAEPLEWIIGES